MTAMELEAQKALLVRDILTDIHDMDMLKKLRKAFDKMLKNKTDEAERSSISKKELDELLRKNSLERR